MVEQAISLEKYGRAERGSMYHVTKEFPLPRTRQAWEVKSHIHVDLDSNRRISLFTRKVEDFCLPTLIGFGTTEKFSYSEIYCMAWSTLKERGFNVVPTVRMLDANTVATTNLTLDELTSIYDQKIDADEVRNTFPLDSAFVKIPIEKIQKEAEQLVQLANRTGVELMSDGPFHIVVQGDSSWYLSILDIGKVRIYAKPKDMPKASAKDNIFYVRRAVTAFATIQRNIKSIRDARGLP